MCASVSPMLDRLTDARGQVASEWATAPLAGSGRRLELLPDAGGLILSTGTGRVRTDAGALPVRTDAVDGLCVTAVLAGAGDIDGLFSEVRRVLRPAGTLVVVTPSAIVRSPAQWRLRDVHRKGWANRSGLDDAGWLLAAADFAVLADDRVAFSVEVPAGRHVELAGALTAAGLWPPSVPGDTIDRLGAGGRWPVPLRRLVARR